MEDSSILYQRFLNGDQEALTILVERYANPLILFINTYTKDYHTAEDLMEDCFVELLVKKPAFRGESKFKTFLFQIAKNKALNTINRKKRFIWMSEEDAQHELREEATVLDDLQASEEKRKLYAAIKQIPENYAQAIQLIYFEELTYEEAAEIMGKTKKQIDNYIFRGKKALEKILRKEDEK